MIVTKFYFLVAPTKPKISLPATTYVGVKGYTITCESQGFPEPSYKIIYNGTIEVSTTNTYVISEVDYDHAGLYECIAKNNLGKNSVTGFLTVNGKRNFIGGKTVS